jgi:hypothetical protein
MAELGSIKDQIKKDVNRTYQEQEYFRKEEVKTALTEILVLWAGKNPETQYKQGMNDIAGLLLQTFAEAQVANPYEDSSLDSIAESSLSLTIP